MKFLVLSYNSVLFHDEVANAICERMKFYGHECNCRDLEEYSSETPDNEYVGIRFNKQTLVDYSDKLKSHNARNVSSSFFFSVTYAKHIYEDFTANAYDAIICTNIFSALAASYVKNKYCRSVSVYVVSTEYTYCPFYDELDVNRIFISSAAIKHEYTDRGISEEKLVCSGIPVEYRYSNGMTKDEARMILGLPCDRFICVIFADNDSFSNIYDFIDIILERPLSGYDIIVYAGNNHKLRNGITERYYKYQNICALGFTDKVHLYMKSADLIITNPNGISSTKVMVMRTPLLLINPKHGSETYNFRSLIELGVAIGGRDTQEIVFGFESVLINEKVRDLLVYNQNRYINASSADDICNSIFNDF